MTHVKKCIAEIQRMIDEEGLQGISAVRFDRGGTPLDVLKSKQREYAMYTGDTRGMTLLTKAKGKHASIAGIAKELLAMFRAEELCSTTLYPDGTVDYVNGGCQLDLPRQEIKCSLEADKIISKHLVNGKFNDSQRK